MNQPFTRDRIDSAPRRTRPLKVGLSLPETEFRRGPEVARWSELRLLAERAEAVGFDSLWVIDRLLFPAGDEYVGVPVRRRMVGGRPGHCWLPWRRSPPGSSWRRW